MENAPITPEEAAQTAEFNRRLSIVPRISGFIIGATTLSAVPGAIMERAATSGDNKIALLIGPPLTYAAFKVANYIKHSAAPVAPLPEPQPAPELILSEPPVTEHIFDQEKLASGVAI